MPFRPTGSENESESDESARSSDTLSTANARTGKVSTAGVVVQRKTSSRSQSSRGASHDSESHVIPDKIDLWNERSVHRSRLNAYHDGLDEDDANVPESVRKIISSTGHSLDTAVQRTMESRMGEDFSDVQVHTGPRAAKAAEDINAKAFTVGNHVAFNRGEYDPSSAEGQHVIAHELAHVRQQTDGAVSMLPQDDVQLEIDPDPELEREAEETAQRVIDGGELGIQRLSKTEMYVQRDHKKQKRNSGRFGELKEEYRKRRNNEHPKAYLRENRPKYADGQVLQVWKAAKNARGDVICPVTGERLEWNREKNDRSNQWNMGHKPGREYQYLVDYLLHRVISFEQFMAEFHDPENYRPEAPDLGHAHEGEGEYWTDKWGNIEDYVND